MTTLDELARLFADPPAEYGPIDEWWWEGGRLDKDKLRWQLEELKAKGISGSMFYCRYLYGEPLGSDPAYFTERWWELTRFAAAEHKRLGLIDWFSNWTWMQFEQDAIRAQVAANPELEGRRLAEYAVRSTGPGPLRLEIKSEDEILDVAAYRADGDSVDYDTRVDLTTSIHDNAVEWQAPSGGWLLAAVVSSPWDLDYLGADVGDRWNDVILGEYERHLESLMGDPVAAFGPDEMSVLEANTAFSHSVLALIREERGFDPVPQLIGLFHDIGPTTDQIRYSYYDAMTALLEKHLYLAPVRWLHARGMKYVTVSQIGDSPIEHTINYGDVFRFFGSFDIPGNEDAGGAKVGERQLFQSKMSSSVAHLFGRNRATLCVHYGTGWGHTFESNIAYTYEQYAKGLNLYSRHQAAYSLMGGWYEWVPPADHFYHPYWRYWKTFADHVRRLSFVLSQGVHQADVAVLYPLSTIYANWVAGRVSPAEADREDEEALERAFDPAAKAASQSAVDIAAAIYNHGIDFDYVDDRNLADATVDGRVLRIAGMEFRSVLLPSLTTIPIAIAERLREFYDHGGTVGAVGRLPTASVEAGRDDERILDIVEHIFGISPSEPATASITRSNEQGGRAFFIPSDLSALPGAISEAIVLDVVAADGDVFHTHQNVGETQVYLLFNTKDESRDVEVALRTSASIEIWNTFTGERRQVLRSRRGADSTSIRLRMERWEGVVLVCSPDPGVEVVGDDESELTTGEVRDRTTLEIHGFSATGGRRSLRARHDGSEYAGEIDVEVPPEAIVLNGSFAFRLEPTMDNRWGDYRYPASDQLIGAEARVFRHREEGHAGGVDLAWHRPDLDDSDWEQVTYSYGPYWRCIGPFDSSESGHVLERAMAQDPSLDWRLQSFSKQFGYEKAPASHPWHAHLLGVPQNFLVFDEPAAEPQAIGEANIFATGEARVRKVQDPIRTRHYLLSTTLTVVESGEHIFLFGRLRDHDIISMSVREQTPFTYRVPADTQAWIDGKPILNLTDDEGPEVRATVDLTAGQHSVLLKVVEEIVQPDSTAVVSSITSQGSGNYAVFVRSEPAEIDPYVPRLRWFAEPQRLVYDVQEDARSQPRVGWYRFVAPPGLREVVLGAEATDVEAWVDGESVPIVGGSVTLEEPKQATSMVALRITHLPGTYAGAVFREPLELRCEEGTIELGDWSQFGLSTYSGIGVYRKEVWLNAAQTASKVVLDLGHVMTVAEVLVNGKPAGVGMTRPFRFDISPHVIEGANTIEVKVANTLANHMSTYPTKYIREGQTVSGLIGPVELRFLTPVNAVVSNVL